MTAPASRAAAGVLPEAPFSDESAGTTAASFLKLPITAREEAMGGAYSASVGGPEALFLNPAGLPTADDAPPQLGVGYQRLLETAYAGAAAFAARAGPGTLAAGLTYASQSSIQGFDAKGDPSGSFTPYDVAASVGYAARADEKVSVGGAVKLIRSSVADASGTTVAVDVGGKMRGVAEAAEGRVDFGGSLRNLGPPLKVGSQASPLPLELAGGLSWLARPGFAVGADLRLPVDDDPYLCLGFEGTFAVETAKAFLRAGFNQARTRGLDAVAGLSAGAGLDLGRFKFDYAWIPYGDLGATHRLFLGFRF